MTDEMKLRKRTSCVSAGDDKRWACTLMSILFVSPKNDHISVGGYLSVNKFSTVFEICIFKTNNVYRIEENCTELK